MKIERIEVVNLRFDYPGGTGFRYAGGTVTSRVTSNSSVLDASVGSVACVRVSRQRR